ncbi:DUF4214 domain-containing protein [Roseiterribacter gracilis]|uniref:DUF4214 domain-containing protein n=1 Tax=Roseiterribacter gracilis TaxID=2812848 RepID=A0A8S8XCR1_9PROT|nr:hypothetical protein TMPK1_34900 [Rhodospirillales bacterium TMPK1]
MPGTADPISGLLMYPLTPGGLPPLWSQTHGPITLTYAFCDVEPASYPSQTGHLPGFQKITDFVKSELRRELAIVESVCGVTFAETSDVNAANLEFFSYTLPQGVLGMGAYPAVDASGKPLRTAGDIAYAPAVLATIDAQGDYAGGVHHTLIHEILHALGLKHPQDGTVAQQLPAALDHTTLTAMSYSVMPAWPVWRDYRSLFFYNVGSDAPRLLDVNVLQFLYGPSQKITAPGDDVYRYDATPGQHLIVDSGGVDTIDASAAGKHASIIDLRDGTTSSIAMWGSDDWVDTLTVDGHSRATALTAISGAGNALYSGIDNLAIATGSKIENAIGGAANDQLSGNALNNELTGNGGDDLLDGREGFDTAVFNGPSSAYKISRSSVSGAEGTDTLQSIEALRFADKTFFAVSGEDATVARLYGAAFGRAPDAGGLAVQIGAHTGGVPLHSLAANFIASAEFVARYGASTSNADFAKALYGNVLGRTPDPDGLAVQVSALDAGLTRAQLLLNFADSPENQARVAGDWLLV